MKNSNLTCRLLVPVLLAPMLLAACGAGDELLLARWRELGRDRDHADDPDDAPDSEEAPDAAATARRLAAEAVLATYCNACHGPGAVVLGNIADMAGLLDRGYIVPGSPERSRVYTRMATGDDMPPEFVEPRPTPEEIQVVYDFILNLDYLD